MSKPRDRGLTNARKLKKVGGTRAEYLEIADKAVKSAAEKEKWRNSERAMALADNQRIADAVWPAKKLA